MQVLVGLNCSCMVAVLPERSLPVFALIVFLGVAASMCRAFRRGLAVRRLQLRRSEGQAMAEFALIAPVFLLFVAGLLAFGRIFFYWIDANHLANETARWAAVDQNPYAP